mmetsp:Transcript_5932/g.8776  ORF Transcript_5932/g.8776 Transcript_5932/m.8776 type:complete len:141 (-) Transcript_5932:1124-1546(-)
MEFFHFIIHHKHLFKKLLVVKKFFHLEYCVLTILFFVCVIVYMDACLLIAVGGSVCACVCAHIRIFLKGENAFYPSVFFFQITFRGREGAPLLGKKNPPKKKQHIIIHGTNSRCETLFFVNHHHHLQGQLLVLRIHPLLF